MFRHELAGAGGWGDPLEREPAAVLRDVRNEMISSEAAERDYGVLLDCRSWKVDDAATRALRATLRARRPTGEPPSVTRDAAPATGMAAA